MKRQQGFIQGALLIGIALLAIIICVVTLINNNKLTNVSDEKGKVIAALIQGRFAESFETWQVRHRGFH